VRLCLLVVAYLLFWLPASAAAEDGYELWLRYPHLEPARRAAVEAHATTITGRSSSPTLAAAVQELGRGLRGFLGHPIPHTRDVRNGGILYGTPASSRLVARLLPPLIPHHAYVIRSVRSGSKTYTVIGASTDVGVLYGVFGFLRLIQTGKSIDRLAIEDAPRLPLRLLNHWDNPDGSVERGYAGASLWDWRTLPGSKQVRYTDYARANASIGINGTVLNNVNADALALTPTSLRKVRALADLFRPWGIRVYLSARFSAPIVLGGLKTADPLDPLVRQWWARKADGIYAAIPDFGGFLVKANSEGQPGPQDYGRTHADGANMLADALAPHGGNVIWRAFVYSPNGAEDRAMQATDEFAPLDGKFRDNVVLQVKNGPIDFQPREPFHPLFGKMRLTRVMMEGQITKEYLGFSTHLAFLAPLWKEVLDAGTTGPGRPGAAAVSRLLDGSLTGHAGGMAGVANIGGDRNWSGSHFDQANWYGFGRLAWNPDLTSDQIAEEWVRATWSNDPRVVRTVVSMMLGSRQSVVNYMTPLGLHHLMASSHHYGPGPWVDDLARPDWNPVYYHRADRLGIGFDRTVAGSNAVAQYAPAWQQVFNDPRTTPDDLLLWFHHVPWDYRMHSGATLWETLLRRYDSGVADVVAMRRQWQSLDGQVDAQRYREVATSLATQEREARWWRDASIAYWLSVAQRPLPNGVAPPAHDLTTYKAVHFCHVAGDPG